MTAPVTWWSQFTNDSQEPNVCTSSWFHTQWCPLRTLQSASVEQFIPEALEDAIKQGFCLPREPAVTHLLLFRSGLAKLPQGRRLPQHVLPLAEWPAGIWNSSRTLMWAHALDSSHRPHACLSPDMTSTATLVINSVPRLPVCSRMPYVLLKETHMELNKIPVFGFEWTKLALAWEPQSAPTTDPKKNRCSSSASVCALPTAPRVAPRGMPCIFSRFCESYTCPFQFLLWSVVESQPTIQHPVSHLTNINFTKS